MAHAPDVAHSDAIFVLDVSLESGPMTEAFVEENETVSRTIEIRGDQTLLDLHKAIFAAFDREEEHLFCSAFSGTGVWFRGMKASEGRPCPGSRADATRPSRR